MLTEKFITLNRCFRKEGRSKINKLSFYPREWEKKSKLNPKQAGEITKFRGEINEIQNKKENQQNKRLVLKKTGYITPLAILSARLFLSIICHLATGGPHQPHCAVHTAGAGITQGHTRGGNIRGHLRILARSWLSHPDNTVSPKSSDSPHYPSLKIVFNCSAEQRDEYICILTAHWRPFSTTVTFQTSTLTAAPGQAFSQALCLPPSPTPCVLCTCTLSSDPFHPLPSSSVLKAWTSFKMLYQHLYKPLPTLWTHTELISIWICLKVLW